MIKSPDQTAGRSHNVKIVNNSFEMVEQFKYLGTTLTNQNSIREQIKSRLKLGNACYLSVKNLLSSSLVLKILKIKMNIIIILPLVLYGCETWSFILEEKRRLKVFENKVFRRIHGPKRDGVTGERRKLHIEQLNALYCTPNDILQIYVPCCMRHNRAHICAGYHRLYDQPSCILSPRDTTFSYAT
jgi:hypothetical protein